jgi:hypothetical protein
MEHVRSLAEYHAQALINLVAEDLKSGNFLENLEHHKFDNGSLIYTLCNT